MKYEIGTKVHIIGTFLKGKKGVIRKIGRANNGQRIFYVVPIGSNFTTPMMIGQIRRRSK